jgi:ATP-binding cassette subfamily B protein
MGTDRWTLTLAGLATLLNGVAGVTVPVLLGMMVNACQLVAGQVMTLVDWLRIGGPCLGIFALVMIVRECLFVCRKHLVKHVCIRAEGQWTVQVAERLFRADLRAFSDEHTGALQGRVSRAVAGAVQFLRLVVQEFVPAFCTVGSAVACALWKQPAIGLLMLGLTPVALYIVLRQMAAQNGMRRQLMRGRDALDGALTERFAAMEFVRVANTHQEEVARVGELANGRQAVEAAHMWTSLRYDGAKALYQWAFQFSLIACAFWLVLSGRLQVGDILVFWNLSFNVFIPLKDVNRILEEAHESGLEVDELVALLNEPADSSFRTMTDSTLSRPDTGIALYSNPCETTARESLSEHVESLPLVSARNLVVEYRSTGGARVRALDGVSLEINPGETIGIAGRSGSGKTTLIKTLLRLCPPAAGTIRLGGMPIERVSRQTIGRTIGYVGQTPYFFAGTITENIAYGCPGVTGEEVVAAAKQACIHDDIMCMPGGYNALVTERGQNLSGGQRQRLALARILLKDPPILILDEATSALDNITERSVQRALRAARRGRAVIMIAHRLSTLRRADRIFVFDQGQVVETGSYESLVHQGGIFAELARIRRINHSLPRPRT